MPIGNPGEPKRSQENELTVLVRNHGKGMLHHSVRLWRVNAHCWVAHHATVSCYLLRIVGSHWMLH